MQPLLTIVSADTTTESSLANPEDHPRVLSSAFASRLAAATCAERALRDLGFHTASVAWSPKPVLRINVGPNTPAGPLLDRLQTPRFVPGSDATEVYGDFLDVTLWVHLDGRASVAATTCRQEH